MRGVVAESAESAGIAKIAGGAGEGGNRQITPAANHCGGGDTVGAEKLRNIVLFAYHLAGQ